MLTEWLIFSQRACDDWNPYVRRGWKVQRNSSFVTILSHRLIEICWGDRPNPVGAALRRPSPSWRHMLPGGRRNAAPTGERVTSLQIPVYGVGLNSYHHFKGKPLQMIILMVPSITSRLSKKDNLSGRIPVFHDAFGLSPITHWPCEPFSKH